MKVCPLCSRIFSDMLTVCEHDGQRLVAVRRDDPTDAAPVMDWDGPMAGDIIGSYRLESMIAEGGMGRIFRAAHLTLGRTVAIKFLLPEHACRADLVQRFFNEARSVNAIRHPHILEIYDFIQERQPDGRQIVYIVMEHLDGEDLRVRLARKKAIDPATTAHVAAQVAEALAAAHEEGILHRDLKPDNIFLCKRPRDFVKLLDFGAAKAFGERPGHDLTRPGVAIGTPEYMAPEQILNLPLDGRVDAYALGIVLYELLTGTVPFSSQKVGDILAMHNQKEPTAFRDRRDLPHPIPEGMERIVMRCLAKSPRDRYPDLWVVADALRRTIPVAREGTPTGGKGAPANDELEYDDEATTLDRKPSTPVSPVSVGPAAEASDTVPERGPFSSKSNRSSPSHPHQPFKSPPHSGMPSRRAITDETVAGRPIPSRSISEPTGRDVAAKETSQERAVRRRPSQDDNLLDMMVDSAAHPQLDLDPSAMEYQRQTAEADLMEASTKSQPSVWWLGVAVLLVSIAIILYLALGGDS